MNLSRKSRIIGTLLLIVLILISVGVLRALSARKAQQQALVAATNAQDAGRVELAATDVVNAKTITLVQGLPVSGALKAVQSAMIKARVAGEVQGLTVREGDVVKPGQVIARIDASEYQSRVRQAREQAESAKAQVEVVQRQYDNNKALVDQGFISKTALDTSLANLNAAKSTYRAAQAGTDLASKSLDDTVLRSPIAGQVSQRLVQPGERVGVDARIVEVVDLSQLELEATLSAADSTQVRVGQRAQLQIEGMPQVITAEVARINPSTQAGSRSVLAYLSVANTLSARDSNAFALRQGLFAQGTLGTTPTTLLSVPLGSVRTDKPTPYLQTVENGRVVHRPVELGARGTGPAAGNAEPLVGIKGVEENAVVIRGNIGYLREGTAVRFTAITGAAASDPASAAVSGPKAP